MSDAQKEINARIAEFIDFKGLSLHKFGEMASFASGGLSRAIKEHRTFSVEKLMKIYEAFPELNPIWLQFGRGDMIAEGFQLTAAPGKVKVYEKRRLPIDTAEEDRLTLAEAEKRIRELEKQVIVLEAKNETLLDVVRSTNSMGMESKDGKK